MNLAKSLTGLAFAPMRASLAVADAGIGVARGGIGLAYRALGEAKDETRRSPTSVAQLFGIDDAVERANRLARLIRMSPKPPICIRPV